MPGKKLYLTFGIVLVCLLAVGLLLRVRPTDRMPLTGISSPAAPRNNVTITQYPTIVSASATRQVGVPATPYPTLTPSASAFTVPIHSLGSSGITGTATFEDIAGNVAILLHFDGLPEDETVTPVELHYGTCAVPGALAYPMTAPDAGESETDLPIDLKQFNAQRPMAIILYRSLQDHTAMACGDVP